MINTVIKGINLPEKSSIKEDRRLKAKAKGYYFNLYDDKWKLDKNNTVYLSRIKKEISDEVQLESFLKVLSFYASNLSPGYTAQISEYLLHMFRTNGTSEISSTQLINYRYSLPSNREHYLGTIRSFLNKWYQLGYEGVDESIIELLYSWRIKGCSKGDAIKRLDPAMGPLSDNELRAFNEGAVSAFELNTISLEQLAISLVISHTGRRPIQVSQLKVKDVMRGVNKRGEDYYLLNIPRVKQGGKFRDYFKSFATSNDLWMVLNAQANDVIKRIENIITFPIDNNVKSELPLFPDYKLFESIDSLFELKGLLQMDKLHIQSSKITDIIQSVVGISDIHSERTGAKLNIHARRFRYTTGTRAAREGFGELVIAELLDHSDTQNAGVYIKNVPEHVESLDKAVGFQLAPYAQAFAGVLVDSEQDAERGNDPSSRIRTKEGSGIGTCGEHGFCGANVPIPCYTCMHFQPWLDGPHQKVYEDLLSERERVKNITGDMEVAAILDRSILAVAEVILRCEKRRSEIDLERGVSYE